MNSSEENGAALSSGIIETVYAISAALRSGNRDDARVFHKFESGSAQEHAFDQGCQFAAARMLGGAEFALQVRGEAAVNPTTN